MKPSVFQLVVSATLLIAFSSSQVIAAEAVVVVKQADVKTTQKMIQSGNVSLAFCFRSVNLK